MKISAETGGVLKGRLARGSIGILRYQCQCRDSLVQLCASPQVEDMAMHSRPNENACTEWGRSRASSAAVDEGFLLQAPKSARKETPLPNPNWISFVGTLVMIGRSLRSSGAVQQRKGGRVEAEFGSSVMAPASSAFPREAT
jgi:hypothetical protein